MVFHRLMNCGIMVGAIGGIMFYDKPKVAILFVATGLLCAMAALVVRP